MSQLDLETQSLRLERFPQQEDSTNLQAWEAADEYLLKNIDISKAAGRPVLLFNDQFGALACALHASNPYSISDSYMSQLGTAHNLRLNRLDEDAVTLLSCMDALPDAPALVVIKIPKALALLEHQLQALRRVVAPDTIIIAGAKARDVHNSTLQLFERILGPTKTSLAWKKARLIHCEVADLPLTETLETADWPLGGTDYVIHNHANVFSRNNLDIGARFFMENLPYNLSGKMADLGCGNGVVGLIAVEQNPDAEMLFVDESYMAVASSRLNIERNLPQDLARCDFMVSHGLAGVERESLQMVFCNPPFHQQHTVSDHVAWQMFCDAKRCLKTGGELMIVGNRHLDYYHKLNRLFGNCETIDSNQKFVVLKAVKTSSGSRHEGGGSGSLDMSYSDF
ncbi:23S rRNA (guanine(1835)-N(2))-methyltransferase RlmG [Yersinia ruckeri]|uniref:23S rRNA (guanine(1835)-N(2))-methyltransferase RlmG n=1 Tax=Yersinia ruckeri TaxID=29486 RepID=UPI0008FDE1F1|nr:23S rRNA (guanine(1835)-N(2))-methyltransferase RlmG [Yersinia ruckeri]EKN4688792.1 23S rRNA (guanine(1835)-N(2))-methyltransferase RlmG [Yersinia ruckeri]OJB82150.1 23S rRNA (guanine(1835)-N(2))-methyltransferase [Yersinia ruckeri]OJB88508.1 23S rRNA (guanine(1835)-N(2))-methyltransferase [Yersinia ruckeri]OJB98298.1 23S rRNA (guanine(1835)-N(2))-methyltransferase [Yersinia ruckeri]OJC01609.1 23S rRNA (guanine(1835)-N(2))-methyltransferase [Yersinia ruckeri]